MSKSKREKYEVICIGEIMPKKSFSCELEARKYIDLWAWKNSYYWEEYQEAIKSEYKVSLNGVTLKINFLDD